MTSEQGRGQFENSATTSFCQDVSLLAELFKKRLSRQLQFKPRLLGTCPEWLPHSGTTRLVVSTCHADATASRATEIRQRFCSEAWRWQRDLILLSILSGIFGAGVGWNVTAVTQGSLTAARIFAAMSMGIPFGLVVWLYRGTPRYRLDLPLTES